MDVGKSIKAIRKRRQMTQAELARKSGISRNYLALVESGSRKPSLEALSKTANALDVDTQELIAGEDFLQDIRERILKKFGGVDQIEEILSEIR